MSIINSVDAPVIAIPSNDVYVSLIGNDTAKANGSIGNPFRTITHALSTITTATDTNPFLIRLGAGVFNETPSIKANISIIGESASSTNINLTSSLNLDITSFNNVISLLDISNLTINGFGFDLNFDLSTALGFNSTNINFENCILNVDNIIHTGRSRAQDFVLYELCTSFSSSLAITNCDFGYKYSYCFGSHTYTDSQNTIVGSILAGVSGTTIISTAAVSPFCVTSFASSSLQPPIALNAVGSNLILNVDSISWKAIGITGGTPIINKDTGESISAGFVPTNYTPVDDSVTGHLKGINAAL